MTIPKKFNLLNNIITVEIDESLIDKQDRTGYADFRQNKIGIIKKEKHNIPDSHIDRIFLHELLHHCFQQLNEDKLRDDEKLIDNLAGLLAQAFSTMEY
jgi:hypothetical protein